MDKSELRHKDVWQFSYRDVAVKIVRWVMPGSELSTLLPNENWNYYIYICLNKLPKETKKSAWPKRLIGGHAILNDRRFFDHDGSWINDLQFHGGITYTQLHIVNGARGDPRVLEVGCDYAHLGDENFTYTQESLAVDAMSTIDSLHELIKYGEPDEPEAHEKRSGDEGDDTSRSV